jgi:hypothetical protein
VRSRSRRTQLSRYRIPAPRSLRPTRCFIRSLTTAPSASSDSSAGPGARRAG